MAENYFILGAGGGIANALARLLKSHGANVYLAGRNQAKIETLAHELGVGFQVIDGTDFTQVEQAITQASSELGGLDGAVNLIGSVLLKPAHLTSAQEWTNVLHTNLTSAFALVRSASTRLRAEGGSIVLMSMRRPASVCRTMKRSRRPKEESKVWFVPPLPPMQQKIFASMPSHPAWCRLL